jgi:hypothetical protein
MKNLFSPLLCILASLIGILLFSQTASAQIYKTNNIFIYGVVEGTSGRITVLLPNGRIGTDGQLNFFGHSYFSCMINNVVYSNNDVAVKPPNAGVTWQLNDGTTEKISDTIVTTWIRDGVQIIQEVFPIEIGQSGQIMMRWKFKNISVSNGAIVSCQYLNDIAITDPKDHGKDNSNDGPIVFYPNSYKDVWQRIPSATTIDIPSFFSAFLRDLPSNNPGVSAIGYLDNPLVGTVKPGTITFGDWKVMCNTAFGHPSPDWPIGAKLGNDNAILTEFSNKSIALNSTTLIAATTYGTGDLKICNGPVTALINYPNTQIWNSKTNKYPLNPFPAEVYLINVLPVGLIAGTLECSCSDHLFIANPSSGSSIVKTDTFKYSILAGEASSHTWQMKADDTNPCQHEFSSLFSLTGSASINGSAVLGDTCGFPVDLKCDTVPIFPLPADINPPLFENAKSAIDHKYTIHVNDAQILDSGMKSITWATNVDLSNFIITIDPPINPCAMDKGDHLITITQLDSLAEACIEFAFTDCAGNNSYDMICMPSALRIVTIPGVIDFGEVHTDSIAQKIINVANPQSNIAVTIDSIYIDKVTRPVFQLLSPPSTPLQLSGNGTLPFSMQYLPTKVAADTGRLEITYHADNVVKKNLSILMNGSGINPASTYSENPSSLSVQILPNPFTKTTQLLIRTERRIFSAELFDVTGKSMKLSPSPIISLDATELGLHPGVYLLKVSDEKETVLTKIVKE